jgi:uncharacterized protein (DUF2126 family)
VLPLARRDDGSGWQSGPWFLRSERCYLYPGDSPLGYRLPLDSLPWVKEGEYPAVIRPIRPRPSARCPAAPKSAASWAARRSLLRLSTDPRRRGWRQGIGNGQCSDAAAVRPRHRLPSNRPTG